MKNKSSIFISKEVFKDRKTIVDNILNGESLPNNIFTSDYKFFKFIEFDELFTEHFYKFYSNYVYQLGLDYFTFYTLNPNPEEYFFKFFSEYNVIDFSAKDSFESFLNKLVSEPHDSPADALRYNSNEILVFNENLDIVIYGNRDEEFVIIAATGCKVMNEFNENYPENLLYDVNEYIENLLPLKFSNFKFTQQQLVFYDNLINNYGHCPN
ncbi:hypothetical protein [Wocania ichthyoenteri]|uniref:hypothetical protein n=1 Tax=Wocania ichthyoenteri TaxID=1230531 RepID=UPI00053F1D3E|nr:hypothetical protein [Wocania ichthyoenteri]